jgi:hypothetical protein
LTLPSSWHCSFRKIVDLQLYTHLVTQRLAFVDLPALQT